MALHGADVDLNALWNQVNGVAGSPAVSVSGGAFSGAATFSSTVGITGLATLTGGLDLRGNIVDGAQASGTVGVPIALGPVGTVTAETIGLQQAAQTATITAGYTTQRFALFAQPTISAATSQTVTNAATVAIANAPAAAGVGPAVITNPYALWVQAGKTQLDGGFAVTGPVSALINSTNTTQVQVGVVGATQPQIDLAMNGFFPVSIDGYQGTLRFLGDQHQALIATMAAPNAHGIAAEQATFRVNAQTTTITAGFTTERFNLFDQPTLTAASGLTVTNAATVAIANAPTVAASAVITNAYALWVQAGTVRFDGLTQTVASAAVAGAGLNVPHGVLPNAPVNGDIWTTTAGLFCRINGVTKTVTVT